MAKNLYKFSLLAIAMIAAWTGSYGATVYQAEYNALDLDDHPMIVTNVTFEGLATLVDITNIVDDISTNMVPALRKEIADASNAGTNYVDSATNMVLREVVPITRTINGAPLTNDVTLTGADIAVSVSDRTKIDAALADKATKAELQDGIANDVTRVWNTDDRTQVRQFISGDRKVYIYRGDISQSKWRRVGGVSATYSYKEMSGGRYVWYAASRNWTLYYDPGTGDIINGGGDTMATVERGLDPVSDDLGSFEYNGVTFTYERPGLLEVGTLALTAGTGHTGNLAALDADGNPTDSGIAKTSLSGSNVKLGAGASIAAGSNNLAVGANAKVNGDWNSRSVAIGPDATSNNERGVAIGDTATVSAAAGVAIGYNAKVAKDAANAIQLGAGENKAADSLQFRDTTVVDGNGRIPTSSLRDIPALESVPSRVIAASTAYAVGDVVGAGGKAYRCKEAYTSATTPADPSSDTKHWAEVPVLTDKLDKTAVSESLLDIPIGNYADMDSIADRLDLVVRALKGLCGPDDRTLYFRSLQDGSTVTMQKVGSAPDVSLEYSVDDGVNWSPFVVGETTVTINRGKWARIRAASDATQTQFATSGLAYNKFSLGGSIAVGGNSMSLFYHEYADIAAAAAFPDTSKSNILTSLFLENVALKDASSLILPATTLATSCYSSMFNGCTSLTAAPELPATTLASSCYFGMFSGCTSLTAAPELPATTLASSCYGVMFNRCTSLTAAPELPATTLATSCYSGMFNGCTSLTAAPELPATTLASSCYSSMFYGCTSLTAAPELPATTLAFQCYSTMFNGCTSLTAAPELPATTLASSCYSGMFNRCTSLTDAPELPATTLALDCYSSMFNHCTSLTSAPELPATTLAYSCYSSMFNDCTSLTAAPELPATTLASQCYSTMFNGCTSLTTVSADFGEWSPSNATSFWLDGVAATGEFHCKPGLDTSTTGGSTVPSGWTVFKDR